MKAKIKLQLGVYDKRPEDGLRILDDPMKQWHEALQTLLDKHPPTSVIIHRLADGSPHLLEFITEVIY